MAYVINVPNHELPYGELLTRIFEAFHVPLNYKKGEDPKRYDYFEETFITMSQLKRENGVWWLDQGEYGSDEKFYDAQVDVEEPVAEAPVVPAYPASPGDSTTQQKEPEAAGDDPSGPSGHISDSVMSKLQGNFERARANIIQVDLAKAQAENARLLAVLRQAQSQPKP
ncbi:hypothetical protein Dimus_001107 [Dionaea muscipula]